MSRQFVGKMQEDTLNTGIYYADIDISGFGGYGKAVYSHLLPVFDQWYMMKDIVDIPSNINFLEDRLYLTDHPDYREERGRFVLCGI